VPADAVLLVAFGGPTRPEEIRPFLANVLRGRPVPPERVEEVVRHYEAIGGRSPLNALTLRQADGLRAALAAAGRPLPVHVGMRSWTPFLGDTLARMRADGVRRAVGVLLAPHATEASRARYTGAVEAARAALGTAAPEVVWVRDWHAHPLFVAAVAERVAAALAALPSDAALVFTAHSVPTAMAAGSPYEAEIRATAAAVCRQLGRARWTLAWQSRSGGPEEPWLEPDVNDALRALAARGTRAVAVAPIGFVADHVEVLYDLDVEARATAVGAGLAFARAGTVNDHPLFLGMLAELVLEAAA
jgi:ferrochelatase